VGPQAVSMLTAALGAATQVTAIAGQRDLVQLVLNHEGGAMSTAALTLDAPPEAAGVELTLWGRVGRSAMPLSGQSAATLLAVAVQELMDNARHGRAAHVCDARFGGYVVDVLALDLRAELGARLAARHRHEILERERVSRDGAPCWATYCGLKRELLSRLPAPAPSGFPGYSGCTTLPSQVPCGTW